MSQDILSLDAVDQLKALSDRRVSAVELLDLEVARHRAQNPRINAVVNTDIDRARGAAAAIDEARAKGAALGVLAGLPMTIKDSLDVEGMPASAGVERFRDREVVDAVMAARVRAAGAVIWGKTNIPVMTGDWQSYNRLYGATNNPWDLERTPGGSSGGSAAALAVQVTALEIGSDIAGSLRVPAAFCGVTAHKPTLCLLPDLGHVPPRPGTLAPDGLSVVGPMARSVRDLSLLLHVLSAGQTPAQIAPADPKTMRVALWLDDPAMLLDAEVRITIETWAADLKSAGVTLTPIASPLSAPALLWTYNFLLMAYLAGGFPEGTWKDWASKRSIAAGKMKKGAGPLSFAATILAATSTHREWLVANEKRYQLKAQMAEIFRDWDAIVTPVAPVVPFLHDHSEFQHRKLFCSNGDKADYASMKTWVALATCLGLPATAIPAGFSTNGLPVGVQVIGPQDADARTLAIAHTLEQAVGGYVAPPLGAL
ncbi:MAG TPA: amidase family protein [Caulobacteraceae bacterium]|nr:amidase family protein [Caulobacteraceae bacterium]